MNELVGLRIARLLPDAVTLERTKAKRSERTVYFDWGQLGQGRTLVPPYTVRGRPGAPVSMPIEWSEVDEMAASRSKRPTTELMARWNLKNVPALLAEHGDAWAKGFSRGQELEPALDKARGRWDAESKGA